MVDLGQLIVSAKVRRAGTGIFPLLSMTMHEGLVDQAAKFKKRVASDDTSDYKVVSEGQLVVGFPIDEGVLDFQSLYKEGIVSPAYGVWDVRTDNTLDRGYLRRFLRSPQALNYYRTKLRGSTARRRSLPSEIFLALPVPLPPLDEQRRISAILEQADALRAKRRKVIAHLDDLKQSIFLDMFGDPVRSPRNTETVELGSVLTGIESGTSPVCADRPAQPGEWGILKLGSVSYGNFNARENKAFLGDLTRIRAVEVRLGDLLFSRKNTKDLVGATVVVDNVAPGLLLPDLVFRLNLDPRRAGAEYLHTQFRTLSKRAQIVALASGSASSMVNISQERLRKLNIELAPIDLQHKFARRIAAIPRPDTSDLDELFASLQYRAFRGEL